MNKKVSFAKEQIWQETSKIYVCLAASLQLRLQHMNMVNAPLSNSVSLDE